MNSIPLIKGNTPQEINTSIIALKKALSELEAQDRLLQGNDKEVQNKIKQINELIEGINTHLGTVDTHLNTIDSQITALQPVDTVTSGNMHSVTSNAVAVQLSGGRLHNIKVADSDGGSWIESRNRAVAKNTGYTAPQGNVYYPTMSTKTKNGEWSIGSLSGYDELHLSYTTDSDYNNAINNAIVQTLNVQGDFSGGLFFANSSWKKRIYHNSVHHNAGDNSCQMYTGLTQEIIPFNWYGVAYCYSSNLGFKLDGMWTNQALSEWQSVSCVGNIRAGTETYVYFKFAPSLAGVEFDIFFTLEYYEL